MKNLIFLVVVLGMFTVGCNSFMIAGLLPQIGQTIGQPIAVTGQGITLFSVAYFFSAPLFSMTFSNKPVKFIIQISTGYANFCDTVIAPSESVAEMIKERGVKTPVVVIPTGLHLNQFTGTSKN